MSVKPELILHIGMGKTGTTALQEAFWANRKALALAGVTYPTIGAVASAHHLITPFVPKSLLGNGWKFLKPADWAPALAASGAKRILMSSELIAWASPAVAADFCSTLKTHFDLKVCLYLRRQDNIIMAGYNQQIKAGNQTNPIAKVLDRMIETFDFATTISTWEQAAGSDNLIIRPYERAQFPKGDLICDFLNGVLGIEVPADFKRLPKDNSNPRFSHVALEYKRLINLICQEAKVSAGFTDALMAYSQTSDVASAAVFFEQGLLTIDERRRILDHFANQNQDIARQFLGRESLFLDDLSNDAAVAPAVTEADLKTTSDWLTLHHPRLVAKLRSAALQAKDHDRPAIKRAGLMLLRSMGDAGAAKVQKAKAPKGGPLAAPAGPRVIIHPGLPKTGTTAIQEAFFKNRDLLLRDHGILYPALDENHTQPILALFRADALANIRFAGMSEAKLATYRTTVRTALEKQITSGGWHTLVISGEGISTLNAQGWADLVAWLGALGLHRIEVVFGVRDGLDLVRSSIQQNIKSGMRLEDQYETPPILRSKARLTPIVATLGKRNIHVWDFDLARRSQSGLVHHFCAYLGLAPAVCDLLAATPVFQNESMTQSGVDALAERNRKLAKPKGVTGAEQSYFLSLKGPKFELPPDVSVKVKKIVEQDAFWLEKTFPTSERRSLPADVPPRMTKGLAAATKEPGSLPLRRRLSAFAGRALTLVREGRAALGPSAEVAATAGTREIFVHFGIRKTGSSSIQQTLFDAAGALQNAAYVHGKLPNSSLMVRNGFLDTQSLARKIGGPDAQEKIDRLRQSARLSLTASLSRAAKTSDRLILSAESISDLQPGDLEQLAQSWASYTAKTTWVGYIRDPAAYMRSAFQQSIKQSVPKTFNLDSEARAALKYHQIVDRLDAQFGRDNLRAFAFDRALFPEGDVVRHFLQVCGIDPASVEVKRVNESLSMLGVKLLFTYRRLLVPKDSPSAKLDNPTRFIAALEGLKGPAFLFHPDVEKHVERSNQHIFDWAEQRLGQALPRGANQNDIGIRSEADLMAFTKEDMAQLADFAAQYGIHDLSSTADAQAIAEVVQRIRHALGKK